MLCNARKMGFGGGAPALCLALEKGLDKVQFKFSSTFSKGAEIDSVSVELLVEYYTMKGEVVGSIY